MENYPSEDACAQPDKRKKVYVIYGRDAAMRDAMYEFLCALSLQPIEEEVARSLTKEPSPFIGHIIDAAFEHAQAIIVIWSGEDRVRLREKFWNEHDRSNEKTFQLQPGQDQIFQAGYAFGKVPERTILVQIGNVKLFSDIEGRHIANFTGTIPERHALKNQLKELGCELDDSGIAWLSAGNFQKVIT